MITLLTAISPEAKAVLSALSLKKVPDSGNLNIYENDSLRLLVTGAGKLNAAMSVTEYLVRYPFTDTDLFCNIGICGTSSDVAVGTGFFCTSVTDLATGVSIYPETYCHPFSEALLYTSDTPVTDTSSFPKKEGNLPQLFDMEGYGIAAALFRKVMPSHCFFYKIVSDKCDGTFPTPQAVTGLLQAHLTPLISFLQAQERSLTEKNADEAAKNQTLSSMSDVFTGRFPCSATMEHKLKQLLTYASHAGISLDSFWEAFPEEAATPHKKREALMHLQDLEQAVLFPSSEAAAGTLPCDRKYLLPFRHIYVERTILHHPITERMLHRFPNAAVIPIEHYKDVFNRGRQDLHSQETEPSLILATNRGTLFYPGAPVCQSFGEEHFMYTSCIMNCIYDCDYCYLQGMYPSGNIVVFVNLEDYFTELDKILTKHPVYLCCSYDSDLTALNGLLPHAEEFCRYAKKHPDLRLELRTKSAALPFIRNLPAAKNIVMAFTLSPQELITRYEHYTPSLKARLATAKEAARKGFSLRLCFDPILDVPDAETLYTTLVDDAFAVLSPEEITDISLGVFRLSKDYLKQLKKAKPSCAVSHYPYEQTDGVCHYRTERCDELLNTVRKALHRHHIPDDKIFIWAPDESAEGEQHDEK